ncbi:hypothetical protein DSO57_1010939 [Entomophthora muscae]|uniref:Uncharacterized protein n=1 Tax=Entomophthora muscae TaxID=34485 RepID=A0ACC2SV93_9FUNG|nr:hypothetical protein DSO57_1010939 [Entomophthora muscae]
MTAFQPLYGKFSDIFGRKSSMLFATTIFLGGSLGCGASPSYWYLVWFRALAGIGAGGLISLPFIIIGDIVPIERRSSYMGMIQATFAISSVIGPLLGGLFVDYFNWRLVFYVNVPISLLALLVVAFLLPGSRNTLNGNLKSKLQRVDVWGTITLVIGTSCIILGLNWGGKDYDWNSPQVIISLVVGLLTLCIFVFVELRVASEPVIPGHIFSRNVMIASTITVSFGFTMFTALNYIPLYHQTVRMRSATESGIQTIPLMLGLSLAACISGLVADRLKMYRPLIWAGMVLVVVGDALWGLARDAITPMEESFFSLLIGIGIGLNIQLGLLTAQLASDEKDMAVVTAFIRYAISIGGVLGLAVHGSIFNNVFAYYLSNAFPVISELQKVKADLSDLSKVNTDALPLVLNAYRSSFRILFLSLVVSASVGMVASWFLEDIPLIKPGLETPVDIIPSVSEANLSKV